MTTPPPTCARIERLAQRGLTPAGLIDVRWAQALVRQRLGWVERRFPLVGRLAARARRDEDDALDAPCDVRLPVSALGAWPSSSGAGGIAAAVGISGMPAASDTRHPPMATRVAGGPPAAEAGPQGSGPGPVPRRATLPPEPATIVDRRWPAPAAAEQPPVVMRIRRPGIHGAALRSAVPAERAGVAAGDAASAAERPLRVAAALHPDAEPPPAMPPAAAAPAGRTAPGAARATQLRREPGTEPRAADAPATPQPPRAAESLHEMERATAAARATTIVRRVIAAAPAAGRAPVQAHAPAAWPEPGRLAAPHPLAAAAASPQPPAARPRSSAAALETARAVPSIPLVAATPLPLPVMPRRPTLLTAATPLPPTVQSAAPPRSPLPPDDMLPVSSAPPADAPRLRLHPHDWERLVERVVRTIVQRLAVDLERRGISRWR